MRRKGVSVGVPTFPVWLEPGDWSLLNRFQAPEFLDDPEYVPIQYVTISRTRAKLLYFVLFIGLIGIDGVP